MCSRRIRLTTRNAGTLIARDFDHGVRGGRAAHDNLFAVVQIFVDGFVSAGDDLVAFLQTSGDFRVIIVADAARDQGGLGLWSPSTRKTASTGLGGSPGLVAELVEMSEFVALAESRALVAVTTEFVGRRVVTHWLGTDRTLVR